MRQSECELGRTVSRDELSRVYSLIDGPTGKNELGIRWLVLFLSCTLMIGNYYCYDNPAALKTQLQDHFPDQKNFDYFFNMLYTVYSIPNIVLPFFGGFFVDKLGVRLMMVVFGGLVLAGQIVFALGCSVSSFPLMLVGRAIFGLGGESMTVGQSALVAEWFQGKELAFALGVNLSIARIGSVINNAVSPAVEQADGVSMALWVGVIICVVSMVAILMLIPIDKGAEKKLGIGSANAVDEGETVNLADAKTFQRSFWLLALSCLVVYGCVLPFNNVASDYLQVRNYFTHDCTYPGYSHSSYCEAVNAGLDPDCDAGEYKGEAYCKDKEAAETKAGHVMSIPYIISAVLSPFLGALVDKYGGRALVAVVAPSLFVVVHFLLGFTSITPVVPLVGLGLSYSIFAAALWPSVPYTVQPHQVGTAYGMVTAVQNGGMALFPLVVAGLKGIGGAQDGYRNVEEFFMGLAVLGIFVGLYLNIIDRRNGHVLNKPHRQQEVSSVDDDMEERLLPGGYPHDVDEENKPSGGF